MLPFLILFLLLSSGPVRSSDCPADCTCLAQDSIFCTSRRANTVPRVPDTTRDLYIFQNGINTLTHQDFSDLGRLEMLDLSHNDLVEVPDGVFGALSVLKNLDLSFNSITHISKDSFSGLVQLERLYLCGNKIESIQWEALEGLEMLLELKLQRNKLTSLPSLRLPSLLLLDLSNNNIPNLGPSDLHTPHLEALKLADMGLTSLNEDLVASLRNLHELDISSNQLTDVPQALKQESLRGLIKLSLASNPLEELTTENFQSLTALQELDLSVLNLQGFPGGFFENFPRLAQLTAAENPFYCMCPLAWFPAWLKDKNVNLRRPEETRCHFPLVNSGKVLAELDYKDFGCPPTTTTPVDSPVPSTSIPQLHTNSPRPTHTAPPLEPSAEPAEPRTEDYARSPEPSIPPSSSSGEFEDHICPPNICLNGGTCRFDASGQLGCLCPSGTLGIYCEDMNEIPEAVHPPITEASLGVPVLPAEEDAISSRKVTATSILLDLHRFIETRPHIRGIRLTYRNLSGPDRRPMILSVPASYPEYTLRGLKPNCTYSVCASPLGERVNTRANGTEEAGSCIEARTAWAMVASPAPRLEPKTPLTYTLIPFLAALALVMLAAPVAGTVICLRKRRQAKAGMELELGPTDPDPSEWDGVKAGLDNGGNGTLPHKQPDTDPCHGPQPSQQNGSLDYEVPLMQGHGPSNNNLAAVKPSYF